MIERTVVYQFHYLSSGLFHIASIILESKFIGSLDL